MALQSLSSYLCPRPSFIFLTSSLATSQFFVAAGNSPDSVLFNPTNSQRSALSTCGYLLRGPASQTVTRVAPELDPKESPESDLNKSPQSESADPIIARRMRSSHDIRTLIDDVGIVGKFDHPKRREETPLKAPIPPRSAFDAVKSSFSQHYPLPSQRAVSPGAIHDQMIIPGQPRSNQAQDSTSSPYRRSAGAPRNRIFSPRAVRTIESSPRIGRAVEINPKKGVDLIRALRRLSAKCTQNNVRVDLIRQRYHERPGLKRKRLKRIHWRARFKAGFREVVEKVHRMRRKGW